MTEYRFNRNRPLVHRPTTGLDASQIEGTPNLRRASLDKAVLFGGPLVRACVEDAPLIGDRKHVIVDTKVSLLMPGWMPAIPGWHTDGVPRGSHHDPAAADTPSMAEQQRQADGGYFPRYHSIIVGTDCPTEFLDNPLTLDLEHGESEELYAEMTRLVDAGGHVVTAPRPDEWVSWDWWTIHQATVAKHRGWRLLIRVTESDTIPPAETGFIRPQNQIANDPPRRWLVRKLSPTCDLTNDGTMVFHKVLMYCSPPVPDRGVVMLIQPRGGVAEIPAVTLPADFDRPDGLGIAGLLRHHGVPVDFQDRG